ncbi:MAG: hypothetical protein EXS43_13935 [Opitutus sp.]|nr:hypothetical protein [Opitutus sp.]
MSVGMSASEVRAHLDGFCMRTERAGRFFGDAMPDYYDVATGRWLMNGGWTEGFWPGLLWRLHLHSPNAGLAEQARRATRWVARVKADVDDHDLGFLFEPSCVLEHEATGNVEMLPAALAAAERLAARYLPAGHYIPAHGALDGPQAGFAIIDTVMNLPLLLWAARHTGDKRFADIATETARTIAREHIRPGGSSCQVLWLDPATGRTVKREAIMAVNVDSCWARGQAWGMLGFARLHQLTGEIGFKQVAEKLAGYFLSRVPSDGVVFHDLDDPTAPDVPKDTSAQAIAAGGLVTLAQCTPGKESVRWRTSAEQLLKPLLDHHLVPENPSDAAPRGLLGHGCKSLRKNQGVVSEIIFGDYYFVDALTRWLRLGSG